jgi:chromosomal replication initiation ATPase DnaA
MGEGARSILVYLAREWGKASVKEIGRGLHRDPSIISRLYSAYAADRDRNKETLLAKPTTTIMQYESLTPSLLHLRLP